MLIADLENFLIEFGFIKKDDQLAGSYKEFVQDNYYIIIRKIVGIKNRIKSRDMSNKIKIEFRRIDEKTNTMRMLPLKGSVNNSLLNISNSKIETVSTLKTVLDYEELIHEGILEIISSIKNEMSAQYRQFKIKKLLI